MKSLRYVTSLCLFLGACSGAPAAPPTLAPGSAATSSSAAPVTVDSTAPTTTAVPSTSNTSATTAPTTTADPAAPEPPGVEEDDFDVIWRRLIEYHNFAFQNPELAAASAYLTEDCECRSVAEDLLESYRQNGWHETSPGLIVHSVTVDLQTSTVGLLTIIDEHSPLTVVDDSGAVVREEPRRPRTFYSARVRLTDGVWKIAEWFQRGAVGDAE